MAKRLFADCSENCSEWLLPFARTGNPFNRWLQSQTGVLGQGYGTKYVTIFQPQQIESSTVVGMFEQLGRVGKGRAWCRFHEPSNPSVNSRNG